MIYDWDSLHTFVTSFIHPPVHQSISFLLFHLIIYLSISAVGDVGDSAVNFFHMVDCQVGISFYFSQSKHFASELLALYCLSAKDKLVN